MYSATIYKQPVHQYQHRLLGNLRTVKPVHMLKEHLKEVKKKKTHIQIRRQLPIVKMSASKKQWILTVVSAQYEKRRQVWWAAQRRYTVHLIRESEVQQIGVYDAEASIKPRPEVTHLLNRGNLLILCLFVLYSWHKFRVSNIDGEDGRLLD